MIRLLKWGELPRDNIAFQLLFDRVGFQKCSSTVGMRYREVTQLFWSIVYWLCKGVGPKFFGGEKNWEQVVNKTSQKSKYMNTKSDVIFAVSDEKVLHEISHKLPKIIPQGNIHSMNVDVDLFGHEEVPNSNELKDYLEKQLKFISNGISNFNQLDASDKSTLITELVEMMTELVKKI